MHRLGSVDDDVQGRSGRNGLIDDGWPRGPAHNSGCLLLKKADGSSRADPQSVMTRRTHEPHLKRLWRSG